MFLSESLPTGYAYEAREHQKQHQLPLPPKAMGSTDFENVYRNIVAFLRERFNNRTPADQPIPVFVDDRSVEIVQSVLKQLAPDPDIIERDILILSLNRLFCELKSRADNVDENHNFHVTNVILNQDRYDFATNIACEFHESENAAKSCSLSIIRRFFYTFCDHVCSQLGIPLKAGTHLPANADISEPGQSNAFVMPQTYQSVPKKEDDTSSVSSFASVVSRGSSYIPLGHISRQSSVDSFPSRSDRRYFE